MCGIAGFWGPTAEPEALLQRMTGTLHRRGPDAQGHWLDVHNTIGLGHRRLAIVDLSAAGAQPMHSSCGRFTISFNGEIYNHLDLRRQLGAHGPAAGWRGHSDTETLVECIRVWGLRRTLAETNGMFAFALWDRSERTLSLARDRFGEKPIYYGYVAGLLVFASELKALHVVPGWTGRVNQEALVHYFRHKCVPAPLSIHEGIHKLPPGCLLVVRQGGASIGPCEPYWDVRAIVEDGMRHRIEDEREIVGQLDGLIGDSVARRMMADVPLGVFLSGGYDSTTVAAFAQKASSTPVSTFSIGFDEPGFNEASHALAVAQHLATRHTELYVTPADALRVIPELPSIYDEPFCGASQIPMYLLSKLARRSVTVALSGDGGDELFAGYHRHVHSEQLWRRVHRVPARLRPMASMVARATMSALRHSAWSGSRADRWLAANSQRIERVVHALRSTDPSALYDNLVSQWDDPRQALANPTTLPWPSEPLRGTASLDSALENFLYWDLTGYLPNEVLTKVDRASMAASLEGRLPFLDHRLVAFAWRIPPRFKVHGGQGKWILRQVVHAYVPPSILDRPKQGFTVPIGAWLRGPLREWASDLLSEGSVRATGLLSPEYVTRCWTDYLADTHTSPNRIWSMLMLQAWASENLKAPV